MVYNYIEKALMLKPHMSRCFQEGHFSEITGLMLRFCGFAVLVIGLEGYDRHLDHVGMQKAKDNCIWHPSHPKPQPDSSYCSHISLLQ